MASVSIGRSRLPPDEIRWLATSGIIATCDPVRDNIVVLTRSMSAATNSLRRSMVADERLSNGTTTAKRSAPERARIQGRASIETLWYRGKCGKTHIFATERIRARAMSRRSVAQARNQVRERIGGVRARPHQ